MSLRLRLKLCFYILRGYKRLPLTSSRPPLPSVHLSYCAKKNIKFFSETPAKKDIGADLLVGVALGLLTTLTLFALLILAFVKVQSRRRGNNNNNSNNNGNGTQQQQQQQQSDDANGSRTFLSASPSSSEDPDVIPLQMSKLSKKENNPLLTCLMKKFRKKIC
jgi:hypothetical protein